MNYKELRVGNYYANIATFLNDHVKDYNYVSAVWIINCDRVYDTYHDPQSVPFTSLILVPLIIGVIAGAINQWGFLDTLIFLNMLLLG